MVGFTNEDKEFIKSRLKDHVFTSLGLCNYNKETNLTKMNNQPRIVWETERMLPSKNLAKVIVLAFCTNGKILKESLKYWLTIFSLIVSTRSWEKT